MRIDGKQMQTHERDNKKKFEQVKRLDMFEGEHRTPNSERYSVYV